MLSPASSSSRGSSRLCEGVRAAPSTLINLRQSVAALATSLLVGLMLTTASTVYAQQLPVRIYTTADGLAHDHVRRIVLDSRGFLWFCTMQGLNRFDGQFVRKRGRSTSPA
jgi:hypothetical protein